MKVFAVSDLHLPGNQHKPMDIFGDNWAGHLEKIKEDWRGKVCEEDVVLIAGDISWAMTLPDALSDLNGLKELPGKKVFIRGNHDYWWSGITALRRSAPDETFFFLQNDSVRFGGSRGWVCPGSPEYAQSDEKIYLREAERFRLAFQDVAKKRQEGDRLLCMIHYPPFNAKREDSLFTGLFRENAADIAVYGHLHRTAGAYPMQCEKDGVRYFLTSCDLLGFRLVQVL